MGSNHANLTMWDQMMGTSDAQDHSKERQLLIMPPDGQASALFERDITSQLKVSYLEWQNTTEIKLQEYFGQFTNIQITKMEVFYKIESETLPDNWHYIFTHKSLAANNTVIMMIEIYYGPPKPEFDANYLASMPKIPLCHHDE